MSDEQARRAALDPTRSFIVQAPAGSGKTELLIQRYLTLLATVSEPEQIVAITFTRKAAAEMRGRVVRALRAAASSASGEHAHQAVTFELASAVAERDRVRGWSLATQPQRMRIDTLDALNVWLAQQLPLLAGGVAGAQITEDPTPQCRQAARRTLRELGDPGPLGTALRTLVRSFDNDVATLETLLAELLPRRDQWLAYLARSRASELRRELEAALERLVIDELATVAASWPSALERETIDLLGHAARSIDSPDLREALAPWLDAERLPDRGLAALRAWRGAAEMLLTRRGDWRRRIGKQQGIGDRQIALRERVQKLLEQLRDNEPLREALSAVERLPDPHYSVAQWERLAALQTVLVRLAAELRVIFAEQQCVDFVELALAAQQALGRVDQPSELLLALDQRIQHVLVDEFQDTSHAQLRLLELLTSGWQPGDGRTLFLVGDPMQSIYRFRDADLSLFLEAKERGVGAVACVNLALERNFRSAPAVVSWVNRVFSTVFPARDQIALGAAGFHGCVATREPHADHHVYVHAFRAEDYDAELEQVLQILEREIARAPDQALAVLVQSRTHLSGLREHLLAKGWPVHAVEIDALTERQLGQDLIGLTRALTHFGDRVAWLGLLRAPWCGLTWADLHALCHDAAERSVWQLMHDPERLERIGTDGRQRLEWLRARLAGALAERATQSLARWVERVWLRLDGPACCDGADDLALAEQFFALLAREERDGDIDDPAALEQTLARIRQSGEPPREAGIEIMTIHRAKGLEFDTVVLLGLGREPRREDSKALHWMERVAAGGTDLILAPPSLPGHDDRLTEFVKRAERQRDLAERARLLYVATTRARDRLHLVCHLRQDAERPPPASLLALLWPHVADAFELAGHEVRDRANEPEQFQPLLVRFADGFALPDADEGAATRALLTGGLGQGDAWPRASSAGVPTAGAPSRPDFEWVGQAAVHVGTVVHRYLQQIAEHGIDRWSEARIRTLSPVFRRELLLLGVEERDLDLAEKRVIAALRDALEDDRGRWVLGSHEEAASELVLACRTLAGLEHLRLDRTFVERGVRWIIDFKTSMHEGAELDAFLDAEVERYRAQLERYAIAMGYIDERPIHVGLYFPLLRAFRSWLPATPGELQP